MRLLVIAESPPTVDPEHGNGSTMITANVLPLLSADIEVDLVYFVDRPSPPDQAVLDRSRSVQALPLLLGWRGWLAQLTSQRPRATALRVLPEETVRAMTAEVDAVYLHGLHTAALGPTIARPTTIHVIDPWSQFWREQAVGKRPHRAGYLREQARRAERLEREIAGWAYSTFVVNERDAASLGERTGGRVVAVPNGVSAAADLGAQVEPDLVSFVGTLDYPPNVEALERLVFRIWPLVRGERPTARLAIVGRRPGGWLRDLDEPGVDVVGPVDDVGRAFSRSAVAAYVGVTGTGTKNTVSEALAAGCPVVASPEAARGQAPNEHLVIAESDQALAQALLQGMVAGASRPGAHAERSWAKAAAEYEAVIRASAEAP
jgi:glycosyltransferase involved in cell wall biosynthesis